MADKYHAVAPTEQDQDQVAVNQMTAEEQALVSWVIPRVSDWADHRDEVYAPKWEEYYRLYRGLWTTEDKNRDSERSRIITPALQQAVESSVAELEEASFGKQVWFDLSDDYSDQDKSDMLPLRDQLLYDLDSVNVVDESMLVILNAAIYGTGIAEILVEEEDERKPVITIDEVTGAPIRDIEETSRFVVRIESIKPQEFCIDPSARSIEEALGCAHEVYRPRHTIVAKQLSGIYNDYELGSLPDTEELEQVVDMNTATTDYVKITKYFGKVPSELLTVGLAEDEEIVDLFPVGQNSDEEAHLDTFESELVEAIVIIANDSVVLKAVENPYIKKDRPLVYFPYEKLPNEFWGRGISEKGYNSQKALDAEMRARIDAMALTTHPMMAADATRLPKGQSLTVRPGKIWLTNGDPKEVFNPMNFGRDISPHTFSQSGELERMVQMATGAMDSATPIGQNPRNATASGMSMIQGGFIKRSKRTMRSLTLNYLSPLIHKAAWRYMQFDPDRYQYGDFKFKVSSAVGIMAREYEQAQLTNLLSVVPQDSPAFAVLLKGIFDNSSMTNKADMMSALDQMMQPNPEQQQMQQMQMVAVQLDLQNKQLENAKLQDEIRKLQAQTVEILVKAQAEGDKLKIEEAKSRIESLRVIMDGIQIGVNQDRVAVEREKVKKLGAKPKNE